MNPIDAIKVNISIFELYFKAKYQIAQHKFTPGANMLNLSRPSTLLLITFFASYANAQPENLLESYNKSNNLAGIINSTLTQPTENNLFYSLKILNECRAIKTDKEHWEISSKKNTKTRNTEQAKAIEKLTERCATIPDEKITDQYITSVASQFSNNNSTWLPSRVNNRTNKIGEIERSFGRKSPHTIQMIEDRRIADINRITLALDPLLIDDYGVRLLLSKDEKTGKPIYKIGKNSYPLDYKIDIGLAMHLVPCEFGLKCDANEFSVLLTCASGGACDSSRFETARRMTTAAGSNYEDTLNMSKEIAKWLKQQRDKNNRAQ